MGDTAPLTLALDTSTDRGVAALLVEGKAPVLRAWEADGKHAENILPQIEALLAESGVGIAEVKLLAVGSGPGSFTGVRIGMATAKGLALARNVPLVAIPSIEVLARGASEHAAGQGAGDHVEIVLALEAFKGEVFGARYRSKGSALEMLEAPFHAVPEAALERLRAGAHANARTFILGSAVHKLGALPETWTRVPSAFDRPDARVLAQMALTQFLHGGQSDLATLEPLYVRGSDATLPAQPLRLDSKVS